MKMQQTKSYWRLVAALGVVSAFVASACVVTTSTDDDDNGGSGGSGAKAGSSTGGSATSGSSSAGSATGGSGTAGSATGGGSNAVPFQCDPEGEGGAQGEGNSCEPVDPKDACQVCVQAKCCAEYSACYATDPGNQCGWGGPQKVNGEDNPGGELTCIHECLKAIVKKNMIAPTDSDVQTCANNCATTLSNGATKECGSVIGVQTSDAVGCMRGNCSLDCFGAE